jgi:hypothetical protein
LYFVDRAIQGKLPVNNIKISMTNRKCEEIQEKPQENLEDDEILREMLEEQRKRQELEDLEKEKSKNSKKKKKKKSEL